MPYVSIALFEGRSDAEKKAVVTRISEAMSEELGIKPEHIWIRFEDTRLEEWFTGSESAAEIRERRANQKQS